jgi:hypothetical protein
MTIFKYLKLLKKKGEEEVCNFNPIFGEDKQKFNIKEYCKVNKININNLSGCECFVCYEKLSDCKRLCLPYKCNHIICYKCFCKHCHSLRRRNELNVTHKVFCPICRRSVNEEWKKSKKMYFFRDMIENLEIEIVFPVSISDVYNSV